MSQQTSQHYQGTEKLLWGIVLAVLTFWLFAGTAGTVAPQILADINANHPYLDTSSMNPAVSITGLMSGLFIVLFGGLADRLGRVRVTLTGVGLNMLGSLLVVLAMGGAALPLLIAGRAIQGFAAGCIMPASMALVKAYWDGKDRQRAVSMWSIGSWGGSGLSAVFGGVVVQYVGWRGIFIASIVISAIAFLMILGTPESRVAKDGSKRFDLPGFIVFVVATLALMLVLLYGSQFGWASVLTITLAVIAIVGYIVFIRIEAHRDNPFIDFGLFKNTTFRGATLSNFLMNGTIAMLIISQQVIQMAGRKADGSAYTALDAGLLSIGYGIFIIAFIRVGEKLLQRFGPRKPMLWAAIICIISCLLLMCTHLLITGYVVLAIIAYCLFGIGLAFYATPSTDAALANLPAAQAGAGSGIYKMASSLGGAIGTAISLAVYYGLQNQPVPDIITMAGRTDNASVRLAAMVALGVSLVFLLLTIVSIVTTIPKGGGSKTGKEESPEPQPQVAPDEAKAAVLARLSALDLSTLERIAEEQVPEK
ncbi:MFS transporter [Neoactinobaculum massilliense]|uniref:MFS transporter n=1 Tax=Neoactinobaculum massilliense TaxID=2364794 RepID=UPI001F14F527|nr:MFS transporter [Neoactinobaculum massilliense]